MINSRKNTEYLLAEMQSKGLASTANGWLVTAIQQKNPALTVGVAYSVLLCYDRLDRALARRATVN